MYPNVSPILQNVPFSLVKGEQKYSGVPSVTVAPGKSSDIVKFGSDEMYPKRTEM